MQPIDEILQTLRRLEPDQRKRVRAELDALEQREAKGTEEFPDEAYGKLLELDGFASSEFTDVSSNKQKYLADAYATKK